MNRVNSTTLDRPCAVDLPLDIFQTICAQTDDKETLKTLSLTCKSLFDISQRLLFSQIEIVEHSYKVAEMETTPLQRFRTLLASNPGIAALVKDFTIVIYYPAELNNTSLPDVLNQLAKLDNFEIQCSSPFVVSWNHIWEPSRFALERIMRSPLLKRLYIRAECIDLPLPDLLISSRSLTHLGLCYIYPSKSSSNTEILLPSSSCNFHDQPSASEIIPSLESFCYVGRTKPATAATMIVRAKRPNGTPLIDFSRLRELWVWCKPSRSGEDDHTFARELLCSVVQLKTLYLRAYASFDGIFHDINPRSLKTLENLRLYLEISREEQDPYLGFTDEIQVISKNNSIKYIELNIIVRGRTGSQCSTKVEDWSRIGLLKRSSGSFPQLRRVHLFVRFLEWSNKDEAPPIYQKLLAMAKSAFKGLEEGFEFQFEVNWVYDKPLYRRLIWFSNF